MTNRDQVRDVVGLILRNAVGILPPNRVADGIADALQAEGLIAPDPPKAYRIDERGCIVLGDGARGVAVLYESTTPAERAAMLDALNAMGGEDAR